MRQETVASRQRLAIMLALADVPPPYGLLVSQIAAVTPWPASVLIPPCTSSNGTASWASAATTPKAWSWVL